MVLFEYFLENEKARSMKGLVRAYETKAFGDPTPDHPLKFKLTVFTEMHLRTHLLCIRRCISGLNFGIIGCLINLL